MKFKDGKTFSAYVRSKLHSSYITQVSKIVSTRMPFSQRPTSCLLIESQTLTIWPWNDLDLGVTLTSFVTLTPEKSIQAKTDVRVAKLAFSMRWPWPWPNDLDTWTWPRYCQDVPQHQKWSLYVNWFKSYSPNRQTHTHTHTHTHYENITSTAYAGGKKASNAGTFVFLSTEQHKIICKLWMMMMVCGMLQSNAVKEKKDESWKMSLSLNQEGNWFPLAS